MTNEDRKILKDFKKVAKLCIAEDRKLLKELAKH
jgi:hypothetical protein